MRPITQIPPIVNDALQAFHEQTGVEGHTELPMRQEQGITVILQRKRKVWRYETVVMPWLTQVHLGLLKTTIAQKKHARRMLVTRYATPDQARQLRDMNCAFIDTCGNAFINEDDLHVFVIGQKRELANEAKGGTLLQPGALKVLFAFLCMEGFEGRTHEEIKQATGVGVGTINRLLHTLENERFLFRLKGRPRRLYGKGDLINTWITAYPQRLRHKQVLGRFTAANEQWWRETNPVAYDAQWGGEVGGYYLTNHLKPQGVTLYADRLPQGLIIKERLRTDPRGEIEILQRFWHFRVDGPRPDVVPPLLAYADLVGTRDDRNIETAKMVYEKHIARYIGKT
jgi:hypothetical protein